MSTYSLDLQFLDPKSKGVPGAPIAQVFVKGGSRLASTVI